jgi:hypothetical protein
MMMMTTTTTASPPFISPLCGFFNITDYSVSYGCVSIYLYLMWKKKIACI